MTIDWFGRYRDIVASLIYFSNSLKLPISKKADLGGDIQLSVSEWQVLEVVVELDDANMIMTDISNRLCMPQSTVSIATKTLVKYGLVEKFRTAENRKNIILKPTQEGINLYADYCQRRVTDVFSVLFRALDPLTDEQLRIVTDGIYALSNALIRDQDRHLEIKPELIKIK